MSNSNAHTGSYEADATALAVEAADTLSQAVARMAQHLAVTVGGEGPAQRDAMRAILDAKAATEQAVGAMMDVEVAA
jgi:molybdopterin biosynthesis enzyme MoaB